MTSRYHGSKISKSQQKELKHRRQRRQQLTIEGHGNELVRNLNILMTRFRARRRSWDIFGLFRNLSQDLWHSTSAQSLVRFLFVMQSSFPVVYIPTHVFRFVCFLNNLYSVYSLCV